MFAVLWLPTARATFARLEIEARASLAARKKNKRKKSTQAEGLFKQVVKAIDLLADNSRHPGLQTHAYSGIDNPYRAGEKFWEAYVQNRTPGAYRIFWCYGPSAGQITIIAITPHP